MKEKRPSYPSDDRPATKEGSEVGYRILQACREAGIAETQGDIARALNVSQMTVSYWLRGMKIPPIHKGIQIANRCKICVEWLYTGKGTKYPVVPDDVLIMAKQFADSSPEFKEFMKKMLEQKGLFEKRKDDK